MSSVFDTFVPSDPAARTPVLVEVPHAGIAIPTELVDSVVPPADAVLRDADLRVDELYAGAPSVGASLLTARFSRFVVDLNRKADDADSQTVEGFPLDIVQPRGVVWRLTTDGRPALTRALARSEFDSRIARFHAPYHAALDAMLKETRDQFGYAILVAAHSMPSVGRSGHSDTGVRRADVVPGTRGRTSAAPNLIDYVDAHFRAAGYSVKHDDPYRGGYTTAHYGRPSEGIHVIQIELNRAIYMDEQTTVRSENFAPLKSCIERMLESLGKLHPQL